MFELPLLPAAPAGASSSPAPPASRPLDCSASSKASTPRLRRWSSGMRNAYPALLERRFSAITNPGFPAPNSPSQVARCMAPIFPGTPPGMDGQITSTCTGLGRLASFMMIDHARLKKEGRAQQENSQSRLGRPCACPYLDLWLFDSCPSLRFTPNHRRRLPTSSSQSGVLVSSFGKDHRGLRPARRPREPPFPPTPGREEHDPSAMLSGKRGAGSSTRSTQPDDAEIGSITPRRTLPGCPTCCCARREGRTRRKASCPSGWAALAASSYVGR